VAIDDFDPFGAPSSSPSTARAAEDDFASFTPASAVPATQVSQSSGPQTSKFDDDDFDFSDMPPAQVDNSEPPATSLNKNTSAFDDEFAGFDDEFESVPTTNNNSGSERSGMSKSFEMVSPSQGQPPQPQASTGNVDEWGQPSAGLGQHQQQAATQSASAFSFDDAFGGDFEPA
jgi:epidermal growth factor receptor substrate 15